MAAHACLKNEFTEDEKYHNLMRWLKWYVCCFFYSTPKGSLPERMVRRYSTVSVEDAEETKANTRISNIFRRRRSSSSSNKSSQFKQLARQLSEEEREINKERLAAVGDLMSVFVDEGEDISSDQDDLIEELQDIGYIITPKHNDVNTTDVLDEGVLNTKNARHTCKNTKQNRNSSFRMVRERKRHSIISTDF